MFNLSTVRSRVNLAAVVVVTILAFGPSTSNAQGLSEAIDAYGAADFDTAIRLFVGVVDDEASYTTDERATALKYLGGAYVARSQTAEARDALEKLILLEPPIFELDPDVDPPTLVDLYYDVRRNICDGCYDVERADPGLQTIAIIDFTNSSIYDAEQLDPLRWGFAADMITLLNGATKLKVVERERLQWLLDEVGLQTQSGVIDQQTAVRAGKLLGVNAVVIGSFQRSSKRNFRISARVVKVETGEILGADEVRGRFSNFDDMTPKLALKIAKIVNVAVSANELSTAERTSSLDAMISYSEGLKLIEQDKYQAAYLKFEEALEFDPSYEKAQKRANSLRPLLAAK